MLDLRLLLPGLLNTHSGSLHSSNSPGAVKPWRDTQELRFAASQNLELLELLVKSWSYPLIEAGSSCSLPSTALNFRLNVLACF